MQQAARISDFTALLIGRSLSQPHAELFTTPGDPRTGPTSPAALVEALFWKHCF